MRMRGPSGGGSQESNIRPRSVSSSTRDATGSPRRRSWATSRRLAHSTRRQSSPFSVTDRSGMVRFNRQARHKDVDRLDATSQLQPGGRIEIGAPANRCSIASDECESPATRDRDQRGEGGRRRLIAEGRLASEALAVLEEHRTFTAALELWPVPGWRCVPARRRPAGATGIRAGK